MKGTCNASPLDWLYYIEKDDKDNIFYDGYKKTKIVQKNGTWEFIRRSYGLPELSVGGVEDLLGRNTWKIINTACKQDKVTDVSIPSAPAWWARSSLVTPAAASVSINVAIITRTVQMGLMKKIAVC